MSFVATALCINLAACSSDDNDPQTTTDGFGVVTNGKKLKKIVEDYGYGRQNETTFNYDKNGRLTEVVRTSPYATNGGGGIYTETYTYTWNETDKSITITAKPTVYDDGWQDTSDSNYYFKGYIINGKFENATYYNGTEKEISSTMTYQQGKLLNCSLYEDGSDNRKYMAEYVWNNDSLTKVYDKISGNTDYAYTYNGKTCKGYNPLIIIMDYYATSLLGEFLYQTDYLLYAHPELLGLRTNVLPSSASIGNQMYTYDYTLDESGYLSEIYEHHSNDDSSIYTFTWE